MWQGVLFMVISHSTHQPWGSEVMCALIAQVTTTIANI